VATTDDPEEYRAITPNDLLLVRPSESLPPGDFPEDARLRKQWQQVQCLANCFWRRFRQDYLPTLQKRQKWLSPRRDFAVNDLVLMYEANIPRNQWKLARIVKVSTSKDNHVRSVRVRTANRKEYDRPVQKIVLLEAAA